ncbi:MAG: cytochrome b/b6 domain-containing protein [Hyphomicrobiaceae bacterium]
MVENIAPSPEFDEPVRVWDRGVRIFHWSLVVAVGTAMALGFLGPKRLLDWHLWAGYAAAALVVFRVVWGFAGTTFARFATFPPSVQSVRQHLTGDRAPGYGHNPVGGLMVYALLAIVAALAMTGLVVLGGVVRQGPLAAFTTYAAGRSVKEVHEWLAWGVVVLVVLHVSGVMFESRRESENLSRAMLTGRKRRRDDRTTPRPARPVRAAIVLAGVAIPLAVAWSMAARAPVSAVPAGPVLAEWKAECGDCHTAHHPSLLPVATWTRLMATLDDHFGEDASLDAGTTAKIRDWLLANAADRFDTRAANAFRVSDVGEPLRLTRTRGWQRIHNHIPPETFKQKSVGGQANCAACHGDAETGLFAPQDIRIPEPSKEQS